MTAPHRIPGLVSTERTIEVPLDHGAPDGEQLTLFAREVVASEREHDDLPWLVFLQGGPGYEGPRPVTRTGWIGRAVREYRVLLPDSRGTGRSSPVSAATVARWGDDAAVARALSHFRADAIVADAECLRRRVAGDRPWTVLGQSFGGFCALHYLSVAPEGLTGVVITGGIPPVGVPLDDVYRATTARVDAATAAYYARYPDDVDRVRRLVDVLARHDVRLPGGERVTPRRLQQLGLAFGMSDGFEQVHGLLEFAFEDGAAGHGVSARFLRDLDHQLPYQVHPIFSMLHEAAYCEGNASRWSAQRVRDEHGRWEGDGDGPFPFSGEMIYPWMFDEYAELRPLKGAAERLAEKDDWPALYDRARLARNEVPTVAAVYAEDMYVERRFSEEVAAGIPRLRTWLTNEHQHNGLRADGERVLGRLLDMLHGKA